MPKIALISLGCAKNLVDSEQMLWRLERAGYELAGDPDGADAVIINTCGFIDSAKSEAIENILQMARLKSEGRLGRIIVTGCLSERYREQVLQELPEVDAVLGVGSFGEIAQTVALALSGETVSSFGDKNAPCPEAGRLVSTGPGWAYIRIAEGCDNRCAYCAIPSIRGRYRSRPMASIVSEACELAAQGVKELIVIAQDVTRWGIDIYGAPSLAKLLPELSLVEGIEWIRLHYLYPDEFTDELIEVIARDDKIIKYLDIPIQHINDAILKRMNRRGTGGEIIALFKRLRERIPGLVLRTSLITGLPGEGEAEFEQLCQFLRQARIERAGVFPFSPEEGTPAAEMTDYCDEETAQSRAEMIMQLQGHIMDEFNDRLIGQTLKVFCDGWDESRELYYGRSWADSPDIDGKVWFSGGAVPGAFADVHITGVMDGDLTGDTI